jgi:hypothetical protein
MSGPGIRQYDIWIDGRKLSARFLLDSETRAGHRLFLKFHGRVSLFDHTHADFRALRRTQPRIDYADLARCCIEFQLKDDENGRRVCIKASETYLHWSERRDDGTEGPFVHFPNYPEVIQQQLVFGRTYVFWDESNVHSRDATMTLCVTDPLAGLEVGDGRPSSPVLFRQSTDTSPACTSSCSSLNYGSCSVGSRECSRT